MAETGRWGGPWTEVKVKVLRDYLQRYQTALKAFRFRKTYIDAFAGDGTWRRELERVGPLFEAFEDQENERLEADSIREGSALAAIGVSPPFDRYLFNDLDARKSEKLLERAADVGLPRGRVEIRAVDANEFVQEFCNSALSRQDRGVVLLDPWGMQLDWKTVECVARTECLDMWYLFPTQAIVRMLPHSAQLPPSWHAKLNTCLGTDIWKTEFYRPIRDEGGLFGNTENRLQRDASFSSVEGFVVRRLKATFRGTVLTNPLRLGPHNRPYFSFCFATANPRERAKGLADRLARGVVRANRT